MIRLKYVVSFSRTYDESCKPVFGEHWATFATAQIDKADRSRAGDNVDIIIWSFIELLSAVICCHLPPLWPLLTKLTASNLFDLKALYAKYFPRRAPGLCVSMEKAPGTVFVLLKMTYRTPRDQTLDAQTSGNAPENALGLQERVVYGEHQCRTMASRSVSGLFETVGRARREAGDSPIDQARSDASEDLSERKMTDL